MAPKYSAFRRTPPDGEDMPTVATAGFFCLTLVCSLAYIAACLGALRATAPYGDWTIGCERKKLRRPGEWWWFNQCLIHFGLMQVLGFLAAFIATAGLVDSFVYSSYGTFDAIVHASAAIALVLMPVALARFCVGTKKRDHFDKAKHAAVFVATFFVAGAGLAWTRDPEAFVFCSIYFLFYFASGMSWWIRHGRYAVRRGAPRESPARDSQHQNRLEPAPAFQSRSPSSEDVD